MYKTDVEWSVYDIPTYERNALKPKVEIGVHYVAPIRQENRHSTVMYCEITEQVRSMGRKDAWMLCAVFALVYIVATVGAA